MPRTPKAKQHNGGGPYGSLRPTHDFHVYLDGRKVLAMSPGGDLSFFDDPDTLTLTAQALDLARAKLTRLGVPDVQKPS